MCHIRKAWNQVFLSQLFHILLCDCVKNDRLYYHDKPCVNREKKGSQLYFLMHQVFSEMWDWRQSNDLCRSSIQLMKPNGFCPVLVCYPIVQKSKIFMSNNLITLLQNFGIFSNKCSAFVYICSTFCCLYLHGLTFLPKKFSINFSVV